MNAQFTRSTTLRHALSALAITATLLACSACTTTGSAKEGAIKMAFRSAERFERSAATSRTADARSSQGR